MKRILLFFMLLFVVISCEKEITEYNCNPVCKDTEVCSKDNRCMTKSSCNPSCATDEICDENNECIAKKCDPTCAADEICNSDFECIKHGCNPTCSENEICDNNNQCVVKECENCNDWEECTSGSCTPKDGKCNIKSDCDDNQICKENSCIEQFCTANKCSNQEICIEDDKKCILNTGKCNDTTNKCEDGFTCNSDGYCIDSNDVIFTTIRELQINPDFIDKKVMTKGVVSAIALSQTRNQKGLYIQDGVDKHSGLYIYFIAAGQTNIKVGDQVKVIGVLDRELKAARVRTNIDEIVVLSSNENIFEKVEVDYFKEDILDYESMLIDVKLETRFNMQIFLSRHLIFMNSEGARILVKDTISWLNHLSLNVKLIKLVGILENSDDGARVLPRSESDIQISTPNCAPECKEWESCLDDNLCVLDAGRCENSTQCGENYSCNTENNYCEVSEIILNNGEFEEWSSGNPTGYFYGSAIKATQESSKKYQTNYGAKVERFEYLADGTSNVNMLSPKIAVDYNKNYKLKLFVLDNDYDVDCRIYYESYNISDIKIGSGSLPSNDGLTKNVDNWMELDFTTNFISQTWREPMENISYIRFGIRVNKGHNNVIDGIPLDNTLPEGYNPSGTGIIYLDSLTIEEL